MTTQAARTRRPAKTEAAPLTGGMDVEQKRLALIELLGTDDLIVVKQFRQRKKDKALTSKIEERTNQMLGLVENVKGDSRLSAEFKQHDDAATAVYNRAKELATEAVKKESAEEGDDLLAGIGDEEESK